MTHSATRRARTRRATTALCAAALVTMLAGFTPRSVLADSGDDTYVTPAIIALAEKAPPADASGEALSAYAAALGREMTLEPAPGVKPLLPAGAVCEGAAMADGVVTVRFALPAGTVLSDGNVESVNMILSRYLALPRGANELRMEAAELPAPGSPARTQPASARPLHTFAPEPPPVPEPLPLDGEPPPTAGPDYQKLYRELQQQAVTGSTERNFAGQSGVGTGSQPAGALSGRTIYFSAGHGYAITAGGVWGYGRGFIQGMNEDFGNLDQTNFFAEAVFNAGGTVVCMRPIGQQTNEVVLDNTSSDVTWTPSIGSWTLSGSSTDNFGDSTGNNMRSINSAATETATATYTPNIPQAGFYPVYCFANAGGNRCSGQLYRVRHSAGETQVRVNHRRVGRGWVWLGTYYFAAGKNAATGSVVISNLEPPGGTSGEVIADAIRFGNGMGSIARTPGISGQEREAEASRYWAQISEAPSTVWDASTDDTSDNVSCPARMAAYMWNDDGQGYNGDIYLGFHTNATGGGARGSMGLITSAVTVTNQSTWAALVSDTLDTMCLIEDANWESTWYNRSSATYTSSYGEIGSALGGKLCGTIIEVAYHDDPIDAKLLRDPKVRYVAARSQVHAAIKYFNQFDGGAIAYPPVPPERVRATNVAGGIRIAWAAVAASGAGPQAATGYRVYTSPDGLNFSLAQTLSGNATTQATITGVPYGTVLYARVTATNAGGESSPGEVVATRSTGGAALPPVLVVSGYDRIDRFNNVPRFPTNPEDSWGERIFVRRNNSYDYARMAAASILSADRYFDMATNEAVVSSDVSLNSYETVVWMTGEEDGANKTLDATERTRIQNFLAAGNTAHNSTGRKLFISGANIANELVTGGVASAFYTGQLRANAAGRTSKVYSATGEPGSALAGITVGFAPGPDMYDAAEADVLATANLSTVAMRYDGTPAGDFLFDAFDSIGSWQDPNYSGSTNADAASTFGINTSTKRQGTGSGALYYVWGTGSLIREYNLARPALPSNAVLSIWVYGDNSGNTISFGCRDATDGEIFENTPMTLNFTGWRQMTWNLQTDPRTRFAGAGDNTWSAATAQLDCILLRKVGAAASGTVYVDELTYPVAAGPSPGIAAVQYTSAANSVVTFGFPFEAIGSFSARNTAMQNVLNYLGTSLNTPVSVSAFEIE